MSEPTESVAFYCCPLPFCIPPHSAREDASSDETVPLLQQLKAKSSQRGESLFTHFDQAPSSHGTQSTFKAKFLKGNQSS